MIDTRIKKLVTLHKLLHGFCAGRGTGTAIMELKLAQDLAIMDQNPLFLLLPDLRKVYENLYRGWILKTLE